jgi:hypothetical protein
VTEFDEYPDEEVIVYKRKRKGRNRFVTGCLGLFILLVICAGFVAVSAYFMLRPAQDASSDFISMLRNQDYVAAYEMSTDDLKSELGNPDGLEKFITENDLIIKSWSFRNINVNNDTNGTFRGVVTLANGQKWGLTLVLLNEDSTWKINGFNFTPPSLGTN